MIYNTGWFQRGVCFQMLISVQSEMSPKDSTLSVRIKAARYITTLKPGKKEAFIQAVDVSGALKSTHTHMHTYAYTHSSLSRQVRLKTRRRRTKGGLCLSSARSVFSHSFTQADPHGTGRSASVCCLSEIQKYHHTLRYSSPRPHTPAQFKQLSAGFYYV